MSAVCSDTMLTAAADLTAADYLDERPDIGVVNLQHGSTHHVVAVDGVETLSTSACMVASTKNVCSPSA